MTNNLQKKERTAVSSNPILAVENLSKSYGDLRILKDVSVAIEAGDFLVLVGPSGCGKSTLLGCIGGLTEITSGNIQIDGQDVTHTDPAKRDIAMVFQSYALFPNMSVGDNIGFGLEVRKVPKTERDEKVNQVAELLKIEPLLDRAPAQLSGGQRQRVAMGRALVRDPKLFLFDEPLSNLDAKLRVTMRTEIKRLHQRLNASIIYVTHDQIEAMTLATKIVVMKDGVIQQVGSPREIYDTPANIFVADFMGSPAMNILDADVTMDGLMARVEIAREDGQEPLILYDTNPGEGITSRPAGPLKVGLRPEALTDLGSRSVNADQQFDCLLDVVEPAGSDTFAVIRLGGTEVTARMHGDVDVNSGDTVPICFDLTKISYFDPKSGERL
ncbi:sn-glycerol-3-phosphate ABC transporter ATP-binding protein UgpC [Parasedimentitalea maritima]|uniref:Sn-glycerol-3-phosphate ABC transporter ATP-binding protein UgpC n=1 Tax=Parasedimentitalea maritima TaxID=2578117 RepID=A0ABY2UVB3_9RHOB|nr:sn-glycerol-3-phosphate ABC transporter ATP-binding protein UgpC [Zongyanglinia marina]TLP65588.1 sn-glycerol-3-phosphate ABC transporter ATP-binding protein UgpC [Zongyanglinia marina]